MHGIEANSIQLLLDHVYKSNIKDYITVDNAQNLLIAADRIQLLDAKKQCTQFISQELDPTNCFDIKSFAKDYDCPDLLAKATDYIEHNFEQVVDCEEFYALNNHQVSALISSDNINVSNEVTVYQCVISWVKHDLETRNQFLPTLMEHVRLPLMSQKFT